MALTSTCLARMGSRFNLILDPFRKEIHYGALGLLCQTVGEMIVEIDDGAGNVCRLPLSKRGKAFDIVDQHQTMTAVRYEAQSIAHGLTLHVEIIAPFWPQDEEVSGVPAYVVNFCLRRRDRVRWTRMDAKLPRKGKLRFGLKLSNARCASAGGRLRYTYGVKVPMVAKSGEGVGGLIHSWDHRKAPMTGSSTDLVFPMNGPWKVAGGLLEATYDVSAEGGECHLSVGMCCYCEDGLFERNGKPMKLAYTARWSSAEDVAAFVATNRRRLIDAARAFDAIFADSALPLAAQQLASLAFQSYLMCTLSTVGDDGGEWFSVWEGSCWYNSTVDVTYNEAPFYFAFWPEKMERIFEEWSQHANDAATEAQRRGCPDDFPGRMLEHDMGAGWTANAQHYHHAMPVEENSNFLLLLYAHGKWWGRESLYKKYDRLSAALTEYLLWTDSTGNGFPDRGTVNTIDDATPAVQYGRDNVYLGVKRLAALHAAARMFEYSGRAKLAQRCRREVRKAVRTLNANWLADHWGVCLDPSAQGLLDSWTGKPLPYKVLPGWDAYSLYTTNGLLYLMMVDDLPAGLNADRLRTDLLSAMRESMTLYGCGHSSTDRQNVWISMNLWRDAAGGYLGQDLLTNCERYWSQQLFANSAGAEKPNCFTETSLTNNLVWYPRGAAIFALLFSQLRLVIDRGAKQATIRPVAAGRWPILPLTDWKRGKVPVAVVEKNTAGRLTTRIEGRARGIQVKVAK